jgi:hypothetical protein
MFVWPTRIPVWGAYYTWHVLGLGQNQGPLEPHVEQSGDNGGGVWSTNTPVQVPIRRFLTAFHFVALDIRNEVPKFLVN